MARTACPYNLSRYRKAKNTALFVDTTIAIPTLLPPDSEPRSQRTTLVQVMPDDHSKSVPPLPIPNRTVKRLCADDSAATSVKVGYRQASYKEKTRSVI